MLFLTITNTPKERGYPHEQEKRRYRGIDQPKVSDIIHGKLSKYTLDRLIRFLGLLGRDIEIHVKRHTKRSEPTSLHVFGDTKRLPNSRRTTA